jgi:ABC-type sulfate transport system permease subunit
MVRKNFEVDVQGLLMPVVPGKKRKHPKESVKSRQLVLTVVVLGVLGLCIHCACLLVFSQEYQSNFDLFEQMTKDSDSVL